MKRQKTIFMIFVMGVLAWGCSESTLPDDAPDGHTVNKDGVAHMPGLDAPETNCVACHGADLRGVENGEPSCFSCHGRKW